MLNNKRKCVIHEITSVNVNQGERETFEIYYRKQRRKQARLALELSHGTRVMLTLTCVLLIGNENLNYNVASKVAQLQPSNLLTSSVCAIIL